VKAVRQHPIPNARNILEVLLDVDGCPLTVFANHWKSGAGDPATEKIRVADARVLRARLDEILQADPHADVIIGGDFNSQYNQKQRYPAMQETGLNDVLRSSGQRARDPRAPARSLQSLVRAAGGPARQRRLSRRVGHADPAYRFARALRLPRRAVRRPFVRRGEIRRPQYDAEGTPRRWTFDGPAGDGYSDHFPVYARFVTVTDNAPTAG
jgi:hypothetical protein